MDEYFRFDCPNCDKSIKAKTSVIGKRARCPNKGCQQVVTIPAPVPVPLDLDTHPTTPDESEADAPARSRPLWPWVAGGIAALALVAG